MAGWLRSAVFAAILGVSAASAQSRSPLPENGAEFHVLLTLPRGIGALPDNNRIRLHGRTAGGHAISATLALRPESLVRLPDGSQRVIFRLAAVNQAAYERFIAAHTGFLPLAPHFNLCREGKLGPGVVRITLGFAGRSKRPLVSFAQDVPTKGHDGSPRLPLCGSAAPVS